MNPSGQRAYLEAMGIPVWISKEHAEQENLQAAPGLKVGPGSSQILLVCAGAEEASRRIAADIARCLKSEPVWAWSEPESEEPLITEVVSEHLFTTVMIFGQDLAAELLGTVVPDTIGSASVITTETLAGLESSPSAKRVLWQQIKAGHLAARRGKSPAK